MPDANRPTPNPGSIGTGLGITALVNLPMLIVGCGTAMSGIGTPIVQAFGLVQLLWMIPLWALVKKHGGPETAKGVLLGTGITFLLSAACWGVFLITFR